MPMFGVPEALLSDRGTNLMSYLMQDAHKLLGIQKLNTTACHMHVTEWWKDSTEH